MPTYTLTRGDRAEYRVTLTTNGSDPYDLVVEQLTPRMQLRRNPQDTNAAIELDCSIVPAIPDNNVVSIVLGAADSTTLPVGTYHGRLLLQHASDPQLDQITNTKYEFRVEPSPTRR